MSSSDSDEVDERVLGQRTSVYSALQNNFTELESSLKARTAALENLRNLLTKRNIALLNDHRPNKWIDTLQAIFQLVKNDRAEVKKAHKAPAIKRLEDSTSTLRIVVEKLNTDFTKLNVKALVSHIIDYMSSDQDREIFALTYFRTLRILLSYPPHLQQLSVSQWENIVMTCFSVTLGDRLKMGQAFKDDAMMDIDGDEEGVVGGVGGANIGGILRDQAQDDKDRPVVRQAATQEDIEILSCIEIIFRSFRSPFQENSQVVLIKFLRFFRSFQGETTAHFPALAALNHAFAALELNDIAQLKVYAPKLWPSILALWGTKSILLKEQVVMALTYLHPFVAPSTGVVDEESQGQIRELYHVILGEPEIRWRGEELNPDCLRMGCAEGEAGAFAAITFCHGTDFTAAQALTWGILELGAASLAKLYEFSEVIRPAAATPDVKRRKIEDPLSTLIDSLRDELTLAPLIHRLQTIVFLVEGRWSTLHLSIAQRLLRTLLHLLTHEEALVQCWSLIALASIAHQDALPDSPPMTDSAASWSQLWSIASRKISLPVVSRFACHAVNILITSGRATPAQVTALIESMTRDLDVQAPHFPSDAVCNFFDHCLAFASNDVKLYRLRLPEKIFAWLSTAWSPMDGIHRPHAINQARPRADPLHPPSFLALVFRLAGLKKTPRIPTAFPLPDGPLPSMFIAAVETKVSRDFALFAKVPLFQSATALKSMDRSHEQHESSAGLQKRISLWFEKVSKDIVNDGARGGEQHWTVESSHDKLRRCLDLATAGLAVEAGFKINGIASSIPAIESACILLHTLAPTLSLKKWTTAERSSVLEGITPLLLPLPDHPCVDFPCLLNPGSASGVARSHIPAPRPSHAAFSYDSVEMEFLRAIWKSDTTKRVINDLAQELHVILLGDSVEDSGALEPTQTQREKDRRVLEKDDDFGEIKVTESAHAKALVSEVRAMDACVSICVRGMVSNEMMETQGLGPVRVSALVEAIKAVDDGGEASIIADQVSSAVLFGVLDLKTSEVAAILETLADGWLRAYRFANDERIHLSCLLVLEATATMWIPEREGAEELRANARGVSAFYARKISSLGWRIRLRFAAFLDYYLTIDTNQSLWKQPDEERIAPTALIPLQMKDPDFRVRFRIATSAAALFNFMHDNEFPASALYEDIQTNATTDTTKFEGLLTQLVCFANIIIVSANRRRIPYYVLLNIACAFEQYTPYIESLLRGTAVRLGLPDHSALYRVYARHVTHLNMAPGRDGLLKYPPVVLGYSTRRESVGATFRSTGGILLFGNKLDEFRFNCEVVQISLENGVLECFSEFVALTVLDFWSTAVGDSPTTIHLMARIEEVAAIGLGVELDNEQVEKLITSVSDQVVTEMLSLMDEGVWSAEKQGSSVAGDKRGGEVFALALGLTSDLHLVQALPPAFRADIVVKASTWFSKRYHIFASLPPIYSVLQGLFSKIQQSIFVDDQLRLFVAIALVFGLGRRKRSAALYESVAESLVLLVKRPDLARLASSLLQWCLNEWMALPEEQGKAGPGGTGASLCEQLLHAANASEVLIKSDDVVRKLVGKRLATMVDTAMRKIEKTGLVTMWDAALLWPREMIEVDKIDSTVINESLASPFFPSGKFGLVRAIQQRRGIVVRRSSLWRLLDSMATNFEPETTDCVALADVLYRADGQVHRPDLEEKPDPAALPPDLSAVEVETDQGIQQVVVAKLLESLSISDKSLAVVVSEAVRSIYSLSPVLAVCSPVFHNSRSEGIIPLLAAPKLLRSHLTREARRRDLIELERDDWIREELPFDRWIRRFCRLLADYRGKDQQVYAQLDALLSKDSSIALSLLGPLVHSVLLDGNFKQDDTDRRILSTYFTKLLRAPATDCPSIHALVDLAVYLRRQSQVNSIDPLQRDHWLEIPWIVLAQAAVTVKAHPTALLFLELAHEYDGLDLQRDLHSPLEEQAQQIHYDIYAAIDDPDGFYGAQSTDVREALTKRYHHENRWSHALHLHGAKFESGVRGGSLETLGVMESLAASGFNRLAMSILQSSRVDGNLAEVDLPTTLPYQLAWQTDTWDLPIEKRAEGTSSVALYSALRSVHAAREESGLQALVDSVLVSEVVKLSTVNIDLPVPSSEAILTILALREVRLWANYSIKDSLDIRISRKMATISDKFSFAHAERILSTRVSLLRSLRNREADDMIGDVLSPLAQQATNAERSCLLELSKTARRGGRLQASMNAVTTAQMLVENGTRDPKVEEEFANVLWSQGEHGTAMSLLKLCYPDKDSRPATVSARLGEWSAEAKIKSAVEILRQYYEPAVIALDSTTPVERTQVYNSFAEFADAQYQESVKSANEKRKRIVLFSKSVDAREWKDRETSELDSAQLSNIKVAKANAMAALAEDKRDLKEEETTSKVLLERALENYAKGLIASDENDNSILRFCALWLAHSDDNDLNRDLIKNYVAKIPSRKFVFMIHQLSARLDKPSISTPFSEVISKLVTRICIDHPFHSLYQVFALRSALAPTPAAPKKKGARRSITSAATEVKTARANAADDVFAMVKSNSPETKLRVEALELTCEAYIEWALYELKADPNLYTRTTHGGSFKKGPHKFPASVRLKNHIKNLPIPPPTYDLPIDPSCQYRHIPTIVGYLPTFTLAGGVNNPSIIQCKISDGRIHTELVKGQDESRQDAVMEQAFVLINGLLDRDERTRQRRLRIRTYKVIPLATHVGIIEHVNNTKSYSEVIMAGYVSYRPKGAYDPAKARKDLSASEKEQKAKVPGWEAKKLTVFNSILDKLPPVMRHAFFQNNKIPSNWLDQRVNFANSVATMSIVGYVLGLGDRHANNILMDRKRGDLVHIDLGITFDQGLKLPIPETVPFRLTQNFIDGFGSNGVEGNFRRSCEETLRVLRKGSNVVMTVLEVFKHDPLQPWALSVDLVNKIQGSTISDPAQAGSTVREELPDDADRALSTVARKLSGKKSVEHAVNELIMRATDQAALSKIFSGWQPYL